MLATIATRAGVIAARSIIAEGGSCSTVTCSVCPFSNFYKNEDCESPIRLRDGHTSDKEPAAVDILEKWLEDHKEEVKRLGL